MGKATHEKKLLDLVSKGDEAAFNELFELYYASVYTAAVKLLHSTTAAEEVVQDVFLDVWMQRHKLPQIENFPAWLNRVSRNIIFTAFNRSIKYKYEELPEEVIIEVDGDNIERYREILKEAVQRLPAKQKETYILIKEEGRKRSEVAEMLNVSQETVKYNLDEAMRKIRGYCLVRVKYLGIVMAGLAMG